jgi:hypothetical protein
LKDSDDYLIKHKQRRIQKNAAKPAIVRLKGSDQLKNPVTSGIEPMTFRLVA